MEYASSYLVGCTLGQAFVSLKHRPSAVPATHKLLNMIANSRSITHTDVNYKTMWQRRPFYCCDWSIVCFRGVNQLYSSHVYVKHKHDFTGTVSNQNSRGRILFLKMNNVFESFFAFFHSLHCQHKQLQTSLAAGTRPPFMSWRRAYNRENRI